VSGARRLAIVVFASFAGAVLAGVGEAPILKLRAAFSQAKEPSKPEAQAKVTEPEVCPSLALQASITLDLSRQAQLQKTPTPPAAHQDIRFQGDAAPELLRLRVEIDGRPFRAAWEEYLDKLFADLDQNGDGALSRAEAARVPGAPFLQALLHGEFPGDAGTAAAPFALLDSDGDGRITRRELASYYRRAGLDAMVLQTLPRRAEADALTDALFRLLDRDDDGILSREELTHAALSLSKVDLDEDEFVTREELLAHDSTARSERGASTTPTRLRFVLASQSASPPAAELLVRLGQPRVPDTRKSSEITLVASNKKVFGVGATSSVSPEPVLAPGQPGTGSEYRTRGTRKSDRDGALVKSKNEVAGAPDPVPTAGQGIALPLGESVLDVRVGAPALATVEGMHQFYLQQFQAADVDRKGALDRRQIAGFPYLNGLFALTDRNGDGKLTLEELSGFLDLHGAGARALTTLTVVDQGIGLFELLDADGDGRLSLREQNAAWSRLRAFDRQGTGRLARAAFPRRHQLWLTRGWPGPTKFARPIEPKPQPAPARGPLWFRSMDVNGDGDVSRREFLGSEEEFRRLDVDGDGLISASEAEASKKEKVKSQK
jgi:Ca2+-binding EF-hand superfamily protein